MTPAYLPELPAGWPVSVDTETGHLNPGGSGLWADSGARQSIISVAYIPPAIVSDPDPRVLREVVKTGKGVVSVAFPFSQGIWIGPGASAPLKPGQQSSLFDSAGDDEGNPNLGSDDLETLYRWLESKRLVFHHAKFDLEKLRYEPLGWPEAPISRALGFGFDLLDVTYWDTQVVCPVIWPRELTSLKPTGDRLWGADSSAEQKALKPYLKSATDPYFDLVPWDVIGPYAAQDAALTIRLFYHQLAELGVWWRDSLDTDRWLWALREIDTMRVLYRMERAGVPYDRARSMQIAAELESRQLYLERQLPFRPTTAQASRFFFTSGSVKGPGGKVRPGLDLMPVSVSDRTGVASFTEQVVRRLLQDLPPDHPGHCVATLWAERAKLSTAVKMWYKPYAEGVGFDGRLRTCFRQVSRGRGETAGGTRSGRFSVERVNLQAIPHDYRLVAGEDKGWPVETPRQLIGSAMGDLPGWHGWEFDLAQAELRLAAAWAKCDRMLDAIKHGRDLHGETTRELFKITPDDPQWDFYRQLGKRGNFTLVFGAGGETFANMIAKETGVALGRDEANKIVADWNAIFPEYKRAINRWSRYVEEHRSVPLASRRGFATGRERVFRADEDDHKAFNQIVQASLAEFMRDWLIQVQRLMDSEGLGYVDGIGWTGLLLTIHDSLVCLLPQERDETIAASVVRIAQELWQEYFGQPDPYNRVRAVEGTADGKRWG